MPKLETSAIGAFFIIDGVQYPKYLWEIFYNNALVTPPDTLDENLVEVGLRHLFTGENLQRPERFSAWTDASDTPYASLTALLTAINDIVGLQPSGGNPFPPGVNDTGQTFVLNGAPQGFDLNADGTKIIYTKGQTDLAERDFTGDPYDISNLSAEGTVTGVPSNCSNVQWIEDGAALFNGTHQSARTQRRNATTAYELPVTLQNTYVHTPIVDNLAHHFWIPPGEATIYVCGWQYDVVRNFSLAVPGDITSIVPAGISTWNPVQVNPYAFSLTPDESKLFFIRGTVMEQYSIGTPGDLSTISALEKSVDLTTIFPGIVAPIQDLKFYQGGQRFMVINSGNLYSGTMNPAFEL